MSTHTERRKQQLDNITAAGSQSKQKTPKPKRGDKKKSEKVVDGSAITPEEAITSLVKLRITLVALNTGGCAQ